MRLKQTSGRPFFKVILFSFIVYATLEALKTMVHKFRCEGDNGPPQTGNHYTQDNPFKPQMLNAQRDAMMSCIDIISLKSPQMSIKGKPDNSGRVARTRMTKSRWFPIILLAQAIRLVRLEAPERIQSGQTLRLRCLYETTKGDKLQSLSWYKNGREFYRYQPFERRQPVLTFNLTGINVDTNRSKNNTIYLTNTIPDTSGRYKCEATATTFQEANMETYVEVVAKGVNSGGDSLDLRWSVLMFLLTTVFITIQ